MALLALLCLALSSQAALVSSPIACLCMVISKQSNSLSYINLMFKLIAILSIRPAAPLEQPLLS